MHFFGHLEFFDTPPIIEAGTSARPARSLRPVAPLFGRGPPQLALLFHASAEEFTGTLEEVQHLLPRADII